MEKNTEETCQSEIFPLSYPFPLSLLQMYRTVKGTDRSCVAGKYIYCLDVLIF